MPINLDRDSVLGEVQRLLSKQPFTKEDSSKVSNLLALADTLGPGATNLRKLRLAQHAAEAGICDPSLAKYMRNVEGVRELTALERDFDIALRYGREHVSEETRALNVAIGSQGGFLVSQNFGDRVWTAMKQYDNLFDASTIVTTETGNAPMPWPMIDDTANSATKVAENTQVTPSDIASFSQVTLNTPDTWRTNMQQVSLEISQDSAFDLQGFLSDVFGLRLARGCGADFISTLTAAAALGKAGSGATAVTFDELLDLMGSVDPQYIASPKCGWLMRFSTLLAIFKLKASTGGSPMVTIDANRFVLFGKPVYICPSVPAMAASAKSIFFGDMSRFIIRRVQDGMEVKRFGETYAEYGMVAFQGFLRVKAALAKPTGSDSPVKYFQNA